MQLKNKKYKIGIVCYPTYGGSGVVATELGMALANKNHEVHFISYSQPFRLDVFSNKTSKIFYLCEQKRFEHENSDSAEGVLKDQDLIKILMGNRFINIGHDRLNT